MIKCFALTLDLKNDPALIQEYEEYHKAVWPEIKESILRAGVLSMEIYRWQNRLFMTMEVDETYTHERKAALDAEDSKVQEWGNLDVKIPTGLARVAAWRKMATNEKHILFEKLTISKF